MEITYTENLDMIEIDQIWDIFIIIICKIKESIFLRFLIKYFIKTSCLDYFDEVASSNLKT